MSTSNKISTQDGCSIWRENIIPFLIIGPLDDAVDTSGFSITWELNEDPSIRSALTLEVGFLCCNVASWALCFAYAFSGLELCLGQSESFDGVPWGLIAKYKQLLNIILKNHEQQAGKMSSKK